VGKAGGTRQWQGDGGLTSAEREESGAATTKFYIDPAEDLVAVSFAERWPFDDRLLNEFQTLLYQSIAR
jgi:hypothetical protein